MMMGFRNLCAILILSCWLCYTHASDCPNFNCPEASRCTGKLYETYTYLEDQTKCPACKKCIKEMSGMDCPPIACPMWSLPKSCKPRFYSLNINYNENECYACDTYICTGKRVRGRFTNL